MSSEADAGRLTRTELVAIVRNLMQTISTLCESGMIDVGVAMQMALVEISSTDAGVDFFAEMHGALSRELRDLVHHIVEGIPNPDVETWTGEIPDDERAGLEKLVAFARERGYRKDDLPSAD
jgi:hypothetical protein